MKVLVDENLPPAMAQALAALFAGTHDVQHIRQRYGPGVTDLHWIPDMSQDGRWVVISADRGIRRKKSEYAAFRSSRLIRFFLAPGLAKAPLVKQMERILALWNDIEAFAARSGPGSLYELPKSGRIRPL